MMLLYLQIDSDHFLNSALGRYDGNVYEALLAWASKDPANHLQVPTPHQEKYLLSILRGKL
jgi:acyl-CoA oxidase